MNVSGHGAIVTGGGSGLGKATAIALAKAGARVLVVDRDEGNGDAVAREIGGKFTRADISDAAALEAAFKNFGAARVLVNTAGVGGPPIRTAGRKGAYPLEVFKQIVEVNLIGAFNAARLAAAQMSELEPLDRGERGVIVLVSSVNAQDAPVGTVAYTASKAGVEGMTLAIARDLAPRGVRCVTIAPGNFDTPLFNQMPTAFREGLLGLVPFPNDRFGDPTDFARLVLQICENVMLNGEVIRLDGAVRHAQHR
jgi:NAD(P)-dependent dehydrogenase (short-subunit alcohol dehydrogenase family)